MDRPRGTAVRVDTGVKGANYASVKVRDSAGNDTNIGTGNAAFVVTSATATEQENVQFQPSTADRVYAYAFGRGLGQLTIGGMAFPQYCAPLVAPGALVPPPSSTLISPGVQLLFDEYEKYRFSKNFSPLQIFFSNMTFNGYLISCNVSYADSAHSIAQWQFSFVTYRTAPVQKLVNAPPTPATPPLRRRNIVIFN